MSNGCLTVEDYINAYEPQYADEVEIQAAELEPWIEERERQLDLHPMFNDVGQRVYQKGLVAWAFSR
ncbi:hypothetical protein LMG27198_39680 [Methylocystis echinoides]|uniref:Uncharacterized protein n=1 Tax=Methylocystis echinoides TaxID=29468 RepID=A0A9W6GXM2_9HYPH|nr:hypothetical protein LMG27198_39680 [Methylocystis echinoides]